MKASISADEDSPKVLLTGSTREQIEVEASSILFLASESNYGAFIVNLQHVRHATSSPTGLQLTLDASTLLVPVSKTYLSLVKASLG